MGERVQYPHGLYPSLSTRAQDPAYLTREQQLDELVRQFHGIVCRNPQRTQWQLPVPLSDPPKVVQLQITVPVDYPQTPVSLHVLDPINSWWVDTESGELTLPSPNSGDSVADVVRAAYTVLTGNQYSPPTHSQSRSRRYAYGPGPPGFHPPGGSGVYPAVGPAALASGMGSQPAPPAYPGAAGNADVGSLKMHIRAALQAMDAPTLTTLMRDSAAFQQLAQSWLARTHTGEQAVAVRRSVKEVAAANRGLVQSIADTSQQIRVSQSGELEPLTQKHDELAARQSAVCSKVDVETLLKAAKADFDGMDQGDADKAQILSQADGGEGGALSPAALATRLSVYLGKRTDYWKASIRLSAAQQLPR